MKILLSAALLAATLGGAQAQSFREAVAARNPIIYNAAENEVGVIQAVTERDGQTLAVVLPTQHFVDLGYYKIALPAEALTPRARGGWYTSIRPDQMPNIKPFTWSGRPVFWRSSGVP